MKRPKRIGLLRKWLPQRSNSRQRRKRGSVRLPSSRGSKNKSRNEGKRQSLKSSRFMKVVSKFSFHLKSNLSYQKSQFKSRRKQLNRLK